MRTEERALSTAAAPVLDLPDQGWWMMFLHSFPLSPLINCHRGWGPRVEHFYFCFSGLMKVHQRPSQTFCCLWSTHYRVHITEPLSANYDLIYEYIINEVSMILPVEGCIYTSDICWHIFMTQAISLFFFLYYLAVNMISRRHLSHLHE